MGIPSRVRRYRNSGSIAEFADSESRRLPSSGSGGGNREGTRGAEVPPVRCPSRRTLETGSQKVPGYPGGCPSGCVRSLAWVGPPAGVGWSAVLVLGAVVRSSCRVWSSGRVVWFRPPGLFLPLFLKRGTGLSTGNPFTTEVLIADVSLPWHWRILQVLSYRSLLPFPPVETLRRLRCRLLRQMRYLFYHCRVFAPWSSRCRCC